MNARLRIFSLSFAYFLGGGALLVLFLGPASPAVSLAIAVAWFIICALNPLFARPRQHRYFLISLAALLCFGCVLWPSVRGWSARWQVVAALDRATFVRLEEYSFGEVLTSVELPRSEWSKVSSALLPAPDIGMADSITLCFVPHHRVVIANERGKSFRLTLCFQCDQATTESSKIFATPYAWRSRLRRLFTEHQIPIRDGKEYNLLRRERASKGP